MIRNNKWKAIVSSLIILLPILAGIILWDKLPANMATHFTPDGTADGFMGKTFAVFVMPVILLALHLVMLAVTSIEWKNKNQNKKVIAIAFLIVPIISLFTGSVIYAVALGWEAKLEILFPIFIGILFILMGNYLPKATRSRTFGIKTFYTLRNDENWHKTHRLGSKLMVATGIVVLFTVFFPIIVSFIAMFVMLAVTIIASYVYSYCIYKEHREAGIKYDTAPRTKGDKIAICITAVAIPLILIGVIILMFTGDVTVTYGDTSFVVDSIYHDASEIKYDAITAIEYRENFNKGIRQYGFASARLMLGSFRNDELGSYILYAYTGKGDAVIISVGDKTLVVGGLTNADTAEIYETLQMKIN